MLRRIAAMLCACALLAALVGSPVPAARHETWVEVRTPNFIIVSNAGEKQARTTAIQFEQIHTLFRDSLAVAKGHPSPVIIILAVKDDKSLSELLPEYWTRGHTHPSGIFVNRLNQYCAAVDLNAQGINPYATMYHEYYHSLTIPYFPELPVWLSEGLADFFGNSEINGTNAMMGMADPDLIEQLRQSKLIPLDVLFHVDTSSPYYNEQNKSTVFYAESWALTHYLMIGDKQAHRQMLVDYAAALSTGASEDQAAAKAFGDLKKLQDQLTRYISKYSFSFFQTTAPEEIPASEVRERSLTDAEVEAYRGGFFAMRGRPEAKQILQNAVALDPRLALAHQNLGLTEFLEGNRDAALASISEAVKLDPKNGLTRYLRAYLSVTDAGGFPPDSEVEEDLRQSIEANPDFPPAYALLGLYLSTRQQSLEEALTFARKAVALEPGNSNYLFDLAQALAQMRRFDDAEYEAKRARANAKNPQERANVDQFVSYLQKARNYGPDGTPTDDAALNSPTLSAQTLPAPTLTTPAAPDPDTASTPGSNSMPAASHEVTGIVAQETCMGGLKIQVVAPTETVTLHLKPATHTAIRMIGSPPPNFEICTGLKGMRVAARYVPDDAKGKLGTIEQLTILPPETPAATPSSASQPAGKNPLHVDPASPREATVNATLQGKVTAVACASNEMNITLLVRETEFALHARDYTRVHFEQEVPFDTGAFQPCTQLKDREATVQYVVTEKEVYDGEIQSVEVGR